VLAPRQGARSQRAREGARRTVCHSSGLPSAIARPRHRLPAVPFRARPRRVRGSSRSTSASGGGELLAGRPVVASKQMPAPVPPLQGDVLDQRRRPSPGCFEADAGGCLEADVVDDGRSWRPAGEGKPDRAAPGVGRAVRYLEAGGAVDVTKREQPSWVRRSRLPGSARTSASSGPAPPASAPPLRPSRPRRPRSAPSPSPSP